MSEFFFFFLFFFIFLHTLKNCCNWQTRPPIQLKFGTLVGHPEAIISTDFGENLYKILKVTIDYLCKTGTILATPTG